MRSLFLAATAVVFGFSVAHAEVIPPVKDEVAKAECSDCHMAYSAILLPKSSWNKILNNLSDHYGEDASLDAETVKHLVKYYEANSSDVIRAEQTALFEVVKAQKSKEGMSAKRLKTLRPPGILRTAAKWSTTGTPERIQDMPRFKRKHNFSANCKPVIESVLKRAKISSMSSCSGCHANMPKTGSAGVVFQTAITLTSAENNCLDN